MSTFFKSLANSAENYTELSEQEIKQSKISNIWEYAKLKHKGQTRKGIDENGDAKPYHAHLFRVLEITLNSVGADISSINDDNVVLFSASLLHDVIEDTELNKETLCYDLIPMLGNEKSKKIAFIVSELSNPENGFGNDKMSKEEKMELKKRWQCEHVKTISDFAKLIKMSDQISNIVDFSEFTIPNSNSKRKFEYFDKAKSVNVSCLENTTNSPIEIQNALSYLNNLTNKSYQYAYNKIKSSELMKSSKLSSINHCCEKD